MKEQYKSIGAPDRCTGRPGAGSIIRDGDAPTLEPVAPPS